MRRRLRRLAPAPLLGLCLLGAWELYAQLGGVEEAVLPAPHAVASSLWNNAGLLGHNFAVTAEEVVLGLALALAAGLAMAVAIHLSPLLRRAFYPLAVGSGVPVPDAVLLVFCGVRDLPCWSIALICFFPVLVTTIDGPAPLDPDEAAVAHARCIALAGAALAERRRRRRPPQRRGSRSRWV